MAYPEHVACFVPPSGDRSTYKQHFDEHAHRLFVTNSSSLEVISTSSDYQEFKINAVDSVETFLQQLTIQEQRIFYLIPQKNSWGRFRISKEDLERILAKHEVFVPFLNVVQGFGFKVKDDEYMDSCYYQHTRRASPDSESPAHFYEVCYKLHYFETNNRNRGDPWSLRQSGVFQKSYSSAKETAWILLGLSQRARAMIEDKLKSGNVLDQHPLMLHMAILSSLATDWTSYIKHLHLLYGDVDDKVTFSRVPQKGWLDDNVSFADYQQLHRLEHKILRASAVLDQSLQISADLHQHVLELDRYDFQYQTDQLLREVKTYQTQIKTYKRSLENLLKRLQGSSILLSKLLELRNAALLKEISLTVQSNLALIQRSASETLRTNSTIADSATDGRKDSQKMQALTLIATLYLPAALVVSVFNSNLVQWKGASDTSGNEQPHYVIVSQFWLFPVCTIALMIVTLLGARFAEVRGWRVGL